jgi:hypothetical protein
MVTREISTGKTHSIQDSQWDTCVYPVLSAIWLETSPNHATASQHRGMTRGKPEKICKGCSTESDEALVYPIATSRRDMRLSDTFIVESAAATTAIMRSSSDNVCQVGETCVSQERGETWCLKTHETRGFLCLGKRF